MYRAVVALSSSSVMIPLLGRGPPRRPPAVSEQATYLALREVAEMRDSETYSELNAHPAAN